MRIIKVNSKVGILKGHDFDVRDIIHIVGIIDGVDDIRVT